MRKRILRGMTVVFGALAVLGVAACQQTGTDEAPQGTEQESPPQGEQPQGAPGQAGAPGQPGSAGQ